MKPVVVPGFPRGAPTPEGTPMYYLEKCSLKTA